MKYLTVFYDDHCDMCCAVREKLILEPKYFPLNFVSLHDREEIQKFPGLKNINMYWEMIAIDDLGNWYKGGKAWIMCLYATIDYRPLSMKMSHPALLPMAKKLCVYISHNRHALSRLFFTKNNKAMKRELTEWKPKECEKGNCTF